MKMWTETSGEGYGNTPEQWRESVSLDDHTYIHTRQGGDPWRGAAFGHLLNQSLSGTYLRAWIRNSAVAIVGSVIFPKHIINPTCL